MVIYGYVLIIAFFIISPSSALHITNLQRKKWNFCYRIQLPSNTLDDRHQQSGAGGGGNQEGWPDHSSEAKELATCYAWSHLEFWQSLQPLRFHTLSHREQAGSSLSNLTRWHEVPNAIGIVHISNLLKSPWKKEEIPFGAIKFQLQQFPLVPSKAPWVVVETLSQ